MSMRTKKRPVRKMCPKPNVPASVRQVWKAMRQRDDDYKLQKLCGKSQPTITQALLYGYASPLVAEQINAFYNERIEQELSILKNYKQLTKIKKDAQDKESSGA